MSHADPHSKVEWRQYLKQIAKKLSEDEKQKASNRICLEIEKIIFSMNPSDVIAVYSALPGEPSLSPLFKNQKLRSRLALPFLDKGEMSFRIGTQLEQTELGFLQPTLEGSNQVMDKDLKAIIVPGLGFDENGTRIGRGKGYYDQTLRHYNGMKVGVCFSALLVRQLPYEDHDVKMDMIITEERILKWKL